MSGNEECGKRPVLLTSAPRSRASTAELPGPFRHHHGNAPIYSHSTYLVLRLASNAVTLKTVLVPQLPPAFLAGHQHVQVADGELWEPRERLAWPVYSFPSTVITTAHT